MNSSRCQLQQFQQLNSLTDELLDEDAINYYDYLQSLYDAMAERFQDIVALTIPV